MKKIKTLSAAALLFIAVSCSKSNNDIQPPSPAVDKKLKEVVYTYTDGSTAAESSTYDAQGRIASYTENSYLYYFSYETATTLKITRKNKSDAAISQERTCTLNENGAITKMVYTSIPGNAITYTYECSYDANGYISKVKGYTASGNMFEEVFETVNGNAVSSKLYRDGILYNNREYSYDLSKTNKAPFTAWSLWPVETLFGKRTKNPLIGYKDFELPGTLIWHTKFSYQLDNAGYPLKMTTNYIHTGEKSEANYIFQ